MRRGMAGAVVAIGLLSGASEAAAADVVASPTGAADAACTVAAPCSLARALAVAGSADAVVLNGGEYRLATTTCTDFVPPPALTISGDQVHGRPGLARPVLSGPSGGCPAVALADGASLRDVDVKTVDQNGVALRLAAGTVGDALRLTGGAQLVGGGTLASSAATTQVELFGSGAQVLHATTGGPIVAEQRSSSDAAADGTVRNSIAFGGLQASGGAATLHAASSFGAVTTSGGGVVDASAPVTVRPTMAGDGLHQLAGSSGVDVAPALTTPFGDDVDGGSRSFGAAPDIGADERGTALPTIVSAGPFVTGGGSSATLRALVDPNGVATAVAAQVDGQAEGAPKDIGDGVADVSVDLPVGGFGPATTYTAHVRANTILSDPFSFSSGAAPVTVFSANGNPYPPVGGPPPGFSFDQIDRLHRGAATLRAKTVKVEKGRARIKLGCPKTAVTRCRLTLVLSVKRGTRTTTYARATATAASGKATTIPVRLTAAARKALKHARKVKVTAVASFSDVNGPGVDARKTLTLTR